MASTNSGTGPKPVRCAVYTRKSTEEGLKRDFNSLDAQRDACQAYIRSQTGEGWSLVLEQYDDGGYTGANMERPGLKQLLADIQASRVDCVVVYKVDRLSRSIRDFAKMMDLFEKQGVSFVSVTQQFNTTTSLGRLTLNILLSFAQFEREIISERTRDKQSAARKRGKWTGGHLILGYDLDARGGHLIVNDAEAEQVRSMFQWYLGGESVARIAIKAQQAGWRNKQWTTAEGKLYGGHPLGRSHLYNLLSNVLYTGRFLVDGALYPGEHDSIVDQETFELVQAKLKLNSRNRDSATRRKTEALLRGLLYCSMCGSAMFPTYSSSGERRYRYYVCLRAQQRKEAHCFTRAVSAPAIEGAVLETVRSIGVHPRVLEGTIRAARREMAHRIGLLGEELHAVQVRVKNFKSQLARMRQLDPARQASLSEQIAAGQAHTTDLKQQIQRLEFRPLGENELREAMKSFDVLWKTMNIQEQCLLLRQVLEKVGYDSRIGKVIVSFRSASVRKLCQDNDEHR